LTESAAGAAALRCERAPVETCRVTTPHSSAAVADPGHAFERNLERARGGSPPACQWLYESVAGRVAGYLRLHGAREPDDLTSEVFLRVFDHLHGFDGDEAGFRSWVFTIAHRLLIDERRKASRRPETVELSDTVAARAAGGNAEVEAFHALEQADTVAMLAALHPDQRDVLVLRIVADLNVEQVAQVLGKSKGAVKSLQHRGVAALRRRLTEVTP
jgi:RNA polymerase sigma-70 factor (ECF subfamily)